MNILAYVPMPMPIVVHGGGGCAPLPHIASMFLIGAVVFLTLGLLGLCVSMLCCVFNKDADTPMQAAVLLITFSVLLLGVTILCWTLGL